MDNIKKSVWKADKKVSKVLDKIKEIQSSKLTLNTREQKHNYIHSLRSKNVPVKFEIRMKEDFEQKFGTNVKLQNWKRYDFEVVKYDYHERDWLLAVSCFAGWRDDQFKIFTDRFEILADEKTIWDTWIIEDSLVTIIKADWDLDGMWGFIKKAEEWKGVASFRNLRWQDFFLVDWDEVEFYNTNVSIVLWEKQDNRDEINKMIDSVEQWKEITEEKYDQIETLFLNGKYSEKTEDEHYKWNWTKFVFDSRDSEWDLDNQLEIIRKVENNKIHYFIDYKY